MFGDYDYIVNGNLSERYLLRGDIPIVISVQLAMVKILVIQSATIQHIPAIVTLDRLCFGKLWTEEGYRREIDSPNSELLLMAVADLVGERINTTTQENSKIIGLGCMWSIVEEAHITLLGIHPDYQQQGLGKLLLVKLLQRALIRQLQRATLEVRLSNQPAIALYETFGFRHAGRRKRYYPTGEDALILWRSGLDKPEFRKDLAEWEHSIGDRLSKNNWSIDT